MSCLENRNARPGDHFGDIRRQWLPAFRASQNNAVGAKQAAFSVHEADPVAEMSVPERFSNPAAQY